MARIDFAFGAPDRLRTACDVVRKHYAAGRSLIVYTQDPALLAQFDQLLWGFDATAFIPHVDAADPLAAQTRVLLTGNTPNPPPAEPAQAPWLVNLDAQCPATTSQFERVLEIVSQDDAQVAAARQRWRQYKADGHAVHAHDLSGSR